MHGPRVFHLGNLLTTESHVMNISANLFIFVYWTDVDRLVEFINRKGLSCLIFKKDLKRAYRQIPVDPNDYHLLGMCIDGQFYFHTVMQFGLRSATLACQHTTKAVS